MKTAPQHRSDGATAVQAVGHRIITPPDDLRQKVRWNANVSVEDIESRTGDSMQAIDAEARIVIAQEIERLAAVLAAALADDATSDPTVRFRMVHRMSNDLRSPAAGFGFHTIAAVCTAMCEFLERVPQTAARRTDVLEALVHALRAIAPAPRKSGTEGADRELASAVIAMVHKVAATG